VLEHGHGGVVGVEVKVGSTVNESDLRGLRKQQSAVAKRFGAGVVLYCGGGTIRFGSAMFAVPVRKLWETP
jgi:hypothetical protein